MGGLQNSTHTVLEFRRALDTCDPEDFVLSVSFCFKYATLQQLISNRLIIAIRNLDSKSSLRQSTSRSGNHSDQ